MAVILHVTAGPAIGRKTFLRMGQVLRIGRTEWSDFNVPQDAAMAPVHFAVEYDARICRVKDLSRGSGMLVNGQAVAEAVIGHGDEITVGATTFSVEIEGNQPIARKAVPVTPSIDAELAALKRSGFARVEIATAADVCERVELEAPALQLLKPGQNTRSFFELLVDRQMTVDAIRFLAYALPKREAVWWAVQCVGAAGKDELPVKDKSALSATENWVLDPAEENRRAAFAAAEATKYDTACGWTAAAAAWSGGSMTPPNLPPVPPKETLTAQAVAVALKLAAARKPKEAVRAYADFLAQGSLVADGKNIWPAKP